MERYANRNGKSSVAGYEIGYDFIRVQFKGNSKIYTYSYRGEAGQYHVDNMKVLAAQGFGCAVILERM
jgi:hypothetical protein